MLLKVLQCTGQLPAPPPPNSHNKELSDPKVEQAWSGHLREIDWGLGGCLGYSGSRRPLRQREGSGLVKKTMWVPGTRSDN